MNLEFTYGNSIVFYCAALVPGGQALGKADFRFLPLGTFGLLEKSSRR
jgi:hypothetical protein